MYFILFMLILGLVVGLLCGYALSGLVERAGSLASPFSRGGAMSGPSIALRVLVATILVIGSAWLFSKALTILSGSPGGPSVLGVAVAGHIFSCALSLWYVALRRRGGETASQEAADR
jgi:hypothetical protein